MPRPPCPVAHRLGPGDCRLSGPAHCSTTLQYPTDVVLLAVLWRLRYKLSFRDGATWELPLQLLTATAVLLAGVLLLRHV